MENKEDVVIDANSVIRKVIPSHATVDNNAVKLMQAQGVEFMEIVYAQAKNKSMLDSRGEVSGEDVLFALKSFGMEEYAESLEIYLHKFRESKGVTQSIES